MEARALEHRIKQTASRKSASPSVPFIRGVQRHGLEQARLSAVHELDNLTRLRLRDLVTDEEFVRQRAELDRRQLQLDQSIARVEEATAWFEPAQKLVSFNERAVSWFRSGDAPRKRLIVQITGLNPRLQNRLLSIEPRKPFRRWSRDESDSDLSGRWESNPVYKTPSLVYCRYTTARFATRT